MRRLALLLLLPLPLLLPGAGAAQEAARVGVRVGDHAGHGRVVFDWPAQTAYAVEEAPGRLVLRFAAPAQLDLAAARRPPRNVRGIEMAGDAVVISFAPGARPRHFRLGPRVVVDVLDPAPEARQAGRPAEPRQGGRAPEARRAAPAPALAAPPPAAPPPSERAATPAAPAAPPPPPEPRGAPVEALAGGLVIPAPAETGAALLRRGATWLLVLDRPVPLDLGALQGTALAGAELAAGPQATVLRIPAAAIAEPRLTRRRDAWLLEASEAAPALRTIRPELEPGPPPRLLLRATRPADTLAVLDPETGGTLLVGTVRDGGEATSLGRRAAAFEILPTRLGAAILPRADTVTLRALPGGFAASPGPGTTLALGPEPGGEEGAAGMTRLFDLPPEPLPGLVQRERNAVLAVAAAPPLGRGPPRLRAAEALLALGLGVEAQAMAALAMREDPRAAEDPAAHALLGAAALLAGRLAEADGLAHPRLPESDELALWRGLLDAARGGEGAAAIAANLPLLRAWPEPLQARLAPLAAEALAGGGEAAAAQRLLAGRDADPSFALARARLLEATGEAAPALAAYDALAQGRDRRARAVAMRRAAELRLATGALDAAGAAAALDAVLAAWRGDAMDSDARLRLAELRRAAGEPRAAFDLLRETEQLFPDLASTLRPRQAEALLEAIGREPPVAAVALFDSHTALLPPGAATEAALAALADRLAALDLVERARAVLRGALARAEGAESRGRLGLRLAELALGAGDPAGARAALADTAGGTLPDVLRRARALAEARALARQGMAGEAAARYREAGPEAAPELAEMLASRQDWAGAAAVLRAHLSATLPPAPAPLPDAARPLVARAAALMALAGDEAGLAALRQGEGARMEGGAFAEVFGLVTAGRLDGVRDLPRLRQELELARALPGRLESLRPPPGAAR